MKQTMVILIFTFITGMIFQAGAVEPTPRYTLAQCVTIAVSRANALANARRDAEIADDTILHTRSQLLPQLAINGSYTRLDKKTTIAINDTSYTLGQLDNFGAAGTANQLIYNGGQINAALRAADAFRDFAFYNVDAIRATLIRDVHTSFNDVLLASAAVEVMRESVTQLKAFVTQSERRFQSQTLSEFDLLNARVRLANEQPRFILAQNQYEMARVTLQNLLHLDPGDFILDGSLDSVHRTLSLPVLLSHATRHRPELRQLSAQLKMREEDIKATRGEYLPEINAFATYKGGNSDSSNFAQDGWEWRWLAGLTAKWTLYDGGSRSARVHMKKLELEKSMANLDEMNRMVALEVRQAFLNLQHAAEMMVGGDENVILSTRALQIARVRFDQGLATHLEFTDANLAHSNARLNLFQSRHAYLNALARLQQAAGYRNDRFEEEP